MKHMEKFAAQIAKPTSSINIRVSLVLKPAHSVDSAFSPTQPSTAYPNPLSKANYEWMRGMLRSANNVTGPCWGMMKPRWLRQAQNRNISTLHEYTVLPTAYTHTNTHTHTHTKCLVPLSAVAKLLKVIPELGMSFLTNGVIALLPKVCLHSNFAYNAGVQCRNVLLCHRPRGLWESKSSGTLPRSPLACLTAFTEFSD